MESARPMSVLSPCAVYLNTALYEIDIVNTLTKRTARARRYGATVLELVRLCRPQQYLEYTKYLKTQVIYKIMKQKYLGDFQTNIFVVQTFAFPKTILLFVVQIRGWDARYRIEETKLVWGHFKNNLFA